MYPCTNCLSASTDPAVYRDKARSHIMSRAFFDWPIVRIAWWIRPPPSRVCAMTNA